MRCPECFSTLSFQLCSSSSSHLSVLKGKHAAAVLTCLSSRDKNYMSVSVCHSIHGIYSVCVCVCVTHWVLWSMQLCDSPACSSWVFSLLLLVLVFSMVWTLWVWEETEDNTCVNYKKKKKNLYGKCIAVYSQVSSVCFSQEAVVDAFFKLEIVSPH